MKVLVTGACGFVGKRVVNELAKYGVDIIVSDIEDTYDTCYNNIRYIKHDFSDDGNGLYEKLGRPDKLIHLAWKGLPNYTEDFHVTYNALNGYNFIKRLVKEGLQDITCAGTCMEYGMKNGLIEDDELTDPITKYGIGKDLLRRMLETLDINLKWLRLFYMYGEGQSERTLFGQLDRAIRANELDFSMSMGEQIRDYLHVNDVARYIVKAALQEKVNGPINICSGSPISIRKFVEDYITSKKSLIKIKLGERPYSSCEPFAFWGSKRKLERILNEGPNQAEN